MDDGFKSHGKTLLRIILTLCLTVPLVLVVGCTSVESVSPPVLRAASHSAEADPKRPSMVKIEAGSFVREISGGWLGDAYEQTVTLSRDFYIAKFEVTQGEYEALMGRNPSEFSNCGASCPVE